MKRHLTRILVSLVPTLIAIGVVAWAYTQFVNGKGGFILGVDLSGGTILVYEVDMTKSKDDLKNPADLANALKRRIDPTDLYNITIRPIQGTPPRVEIILPTGGARQKEAEIAAWKQVIDDAAKEFDFEASEKAYDVPRGNPRELALFISKAAPKADAKKIDTWVENRVGKSDRKMLTGDDVENIKELISKQGQLEFFILANLNDDKAAIDATEKMYASPGLKQKLIDEEKLGNPPPPPGYLDGVREFALGLQGESPHSYRWIEVGKSYLYQLGMNTESLEEQRKLDASSRTGSAVAKIDAALAGNGTFQASGHLFYVRDIKTMTRISRKDQDLGKKREYFILCRNPLPNAEITGDFLVRASPGTDEKGGLSINFTFDAEGGRRFYDLTTRNKPSGADINSFKRQLAIVFDKQIESAPSLNSPIRTNGQITGNYTQQEVSDMVRILRAGALPATLKKDPVSENSMGATLGDHTIKWGTISVLGAFGAVLLFMVVYYRFAGLVACVALFANLVLTIAGMVLLQAAFTLPGLAGLVLMLGMAVDANVLIYERFREERDRGADLRMAIQNGYDRAFATILDTHLSSIFTAIVLFVVGNDQLKGFGISLTMGLVISLYTSLYMTRTIFEVVLSKGWLQPRHMQFTEWLVKLVHYRYWDFMSVRQYWFTGTIILTILGAALFIYRADSNPGTGKATVLNIDFTGGTAYTGRLQQPMEIEELRALLKKEGSEQILPDLALEPLSVGGNEEAGKSSYFTVRTSNKNQEAVLAYISTSLGEKLQTVTLREFTLNKAGNDKTTEAILTFGRTTDKPDYVSQAQVQRLVSAEFIQRRMGRTPFTVDKPEDKSKAENDRYSELAIRFPDPIDSKTLEGVLAAVKTKFEKSPQPERLEVFDAQLASTTRQRALYAILASWAAILLYLWFRFGSWTFGAAAVCCLIHDLLFTLGIIAMCHYLFEASPTVAGFLGLQDFKIDLAAVAALLTLVGYSVNDTIVVFDRIREVRGKNPSLTPQMINDSVNQTLTRTILASATVFVVVLVLYAIGGEGVKLFAFVMIVGVIVGTYSSIYIASPLLLIFGEGKVSHAQADRAPVAATAEA